MVFSSTVFLFIFLPFVLIFYWLLSRGTKNNIVVQNTFLLIMSSFFYYYGEQEKLLLMYFVVLINYVTARIVDSGLEEDCTLQPKAIVQKLSLGVCVATCIGLLWYYKYFNFSFELLAVVFGDNMRNYQVKNIVLPLGISFYTFHVLSYTLDVYFGRMRADKNLLNFTAYVLMFPQLVAGPIVRYRDIAYQFSRRTITSIGRINGIRRFCYGLAKKVLIANTVSVYVDEVFAVPVTQLSTGDCWLGAVAYTLQIYFDFSGYSDMAIGLAMLFGFHYKENFNYPYMAQSAAEFWRRWHISLSTWLRDYVYIHLGGNRGSSLKTYRNVLLVFLCSGLWHGANMTFVCWGLIYGFFIVFENMGLKKLLKKIGPLSHVYLLLVATTAWVLFRADTMSYGYEFIRKMYIPSSVGPTMAISKNVIFAMIIGSILSYDWRPLYKYIIIKAKAFKVAKIVSVVVALFLFVISVTSIVSSSHNPFIYFRF